MKISFSEKPHKDTDLTLIAVAPGEAKKVKGPHAKTVRAILAANEEFDGKPGQMAVALIPGAKTARVGLLGVGDAKERSTLGMEKAGGKMMGTLITIPAGDIFIDCSHSKDLGDADIAAMASGAQLRAYEFRLYKTKNNDQLLPYSVTFGAGKKAQALYAPMAKTAYAVHWARDLVNEPGNVLYPASFAARVKKKLVPLGVKVTILDAKSLEKKGFGAMIAVGKASEYPPCLVLLEYKGRKTKKGSKPVALIGKGITFDTGGYSLKPNAGMLDMKCDMAGAAAVAGAMMALASTKANVHVVAALALAENMISDEGYKPSDIITSLSGQTIEITNTDAEGRLVLCDAMWHVQQTYKPRAMVDIATLTGAALVALGEEFAGLYANTDGLWDGLEAASKATGDRIWRMPLDPVFDRAMDSPIADMRNASATRYGGSCTAAAFLGRFVKKGVDWAHVDMAPTMVYPSENALGPKGPSGFGVRLLAEWVNAA